MSLFCYQKNPEGPFGRTLIDGASCTMLGSKELSVASEGKFFIRNEFFVQFSYTSKLVSPLLSVLMERNVALVPTVTLKDSSVSLIWRKVPKILPICVYMTYK